MSRIKDTIWCDGCGEEVTWVPLMSEGHHYCCQNCLDGLPCKCYRWSDLDLSRQQEEYNNRIENYYNDVEDLNSLI